eukprot:4586363-Prymnesium_polylepis.1
MVLRYHSGSWVVQQGLDSPYYQMGALAGGQTKNTSRPDELGTAVWRIPSSTQPASTKSSE